LEHDFRNLRVLQAAEQLDSMVIALVATIPKGHSKDVDQLLRAAASVPYNIAEANGCTSKGRKANHLGIARGSVDEVRAILRRLVRRGALTENAILKPSILARTIAKMLTSWIGRLS
jgi:four helix bundle protein